MQHGHARPRVSHEKKLQSLCLLLPTDFMENVSIISDIIRGVHVQPFLLCPQFSDLGQKAESSMFNYVMVEQSREGKTSMQ